jgi:hypothetical protein
LQSSKGIHGSEIKGEVIPDLLSRNWTEESLLDQQSLSPLHTLLASQQQNQTLPICSTRNASGIRSRRALIFHEKICERIFSFIWERRDFFFYLSAQDKLQTVCRNLMKDYAGTQNK